MVEPVNDNILNLVNELYNNLDAKDKIINEQALEIARLKENINYKDAYENLKIAYDMLVDIRNKAIEYSKENLFVDSQFIYNILDILGDGNNE